MRSSVTYSFPLLPVFFFSRNTQEISPVRVAVISWFQFTINDVIFNLNLFIPITSFSFAILCGHCCHANQTLTPKYTERSDSAVARMLSVDL